MSLHLAAANPAGARGDRSRVLPAGTWSIADEAHRLTPTASNVFPGGAHGRRQSAAGAADDRDTAPGVRVAVPIAHAPHRPPGVSAWPQSLGDDEVLRRLRPGSVHFLRRMKEGLVDVDGRTPLFKKRTAHNIPVPLSLVEKVIYDESLGSGRWLLPSLTPSGWAGWCMASALRPLCMRCVRRCSAEPPTWAHAGAPRRDGGDQRGGHRRTRADRRHTHRVSIFPSGTTQDRRTGRSASTRNWRSTRSRLRKWPRLRDEILAPNRVTAGGRRAARRVHRVRRHSRLADGAVPRCRLRDVEMYSGRQTHPKREEIRARFIAGDFQVIVSTDAGNEGIDLQSARVLVNWDVPWSLVTLEQRLGRIHRVGQTRDVDLFNLIAVRDPRRRRPRSSAQQPRRGRQRTRRQDVRQPGAGGRASTG